MPDTPNTPAPSGATRPAADPDSHLSQQAREERARRLALREQERRDREREVVADTPARAADVAIRRATITYVDEIAGFSTTTIVEVDGTQVPVLYAVTRDGRTYQLGDMGRFSADRQQDWRELPPVPNTRAREDYDAARGLHDDRYRF